jgi:hypothetical protein
MHEYAIYENQFEQTEAVKQGWSWPAFFFSWIWALVKKMNKIAVVTLACIIIWSFAVGITVALFQSTYSHAASHELDPTVKLVVNLGWFVIQVFFGEKGNIWRENHLISRGYELKTTVRANSDDEAIVGYLKERKANS